VRRSSGKRIEAIVAASAFYLFLVHTFTADAPGLLAHRVLPVLRWRLICPSVLKKGRRPVTVSLFAPTAARGAASASASEFTPMFACRTGLLHAETETGKWRAETGAAKLNRGKGVAASLIASFPIIALSVWQKD
jgi:hypothetical protein